MAFVPDDAIPLMREAKLSPNARLVYEAHCRFRMHAYRVSFATNREIADYLGLPRGSVRNAHLELRDAGWIDQSEHFTRLLVGDFRPVDKFHPQKEIPAGPLFERAGAAEAGPRRHETMTQRHESMTVEGGGRHESVTVEGGGRHESVTQRHETMTVRHESMTPHIDRARDPSQASQASTHTPAARAREASAGPEKRVCVCGLEVSIELLERYARNQSPPVGAGWINVALRECNGHELVRRWLDAQAATHERAGPLDSRDCPDCGGSGMYYPEGHGRGVARCPHAGLYARLAERAEAEARANPPPSEAVA